MVGLPVVLVCVWGELNASCVRATGDWTKRANHRRNEFGDAYVSRFVMAVSR